MNFDDVPNLAKFERFARAHSDNPLVMDCYRRVKELIAPLPPPVFVVRHEAGSPEIADLKASCEAMEKSTRLLWACASAIDHVVPRLWDYRPEYFSAIDFFNAIPDLELMEITKTHRITWE